MSNKSVDKFFLYLDEKHLTKLTPAAFTQSEIITYATQKNFHFSREALKHKIHEIEVTDASNLSEVERAWKQVL